VEEGIHAVMCMLSHAALWKRGNWARPITAPPFRRVFILWLIPSRTFCYGPASPTAARPCSSLLQEAIKHHEWDRLRDRQGGASGLIGTSPAMAVSFIDNHDTGSTQQAWLGVVAEMWAGRRLAGANCLSSVDAPSCHWAGHLGYAHICAQGVDPAMP